MSRRFVLSHEGARARAVDFVRTAPEGYEVLVKEPTRSTDANAAMWPILEAFSVQLPWPVNGEMTHLTSAEWKSLLSALMAMLRWHVASLAVVWRHISPVSIACCSMRASGYSSLTQPSFLAQSASVPCQSRTDTCGRETVFSDRRSSAW